jgi:hypothetical protein
MIATRQPTHSSLAVLTKATQAFVAALRSGLLSISTGLVVGFGLLALRVSFAHVLRTQYLLVDSLLEHVGTGFIIAAIAVFFYEWIFHLRETAKLTQKLVDIVEVSRNESLEGFLTLTLAEDTKHVPDYLKEVISNVRLLVEAVSGLQRQDIWAKEQYIVFVSRLVADVRRNADSLRGLNAGGEHHFIVTPTGADLADAILAAQMRAMAKGDSYDVISNLSSWKGQQLRELHDEERKALQFRGARVRRIFNLTRRYRPPLKDTEAREILLNHFNNSKDWGVTENQISYEVRVLGVEELKRSTSQLLHGRINEAHFGIFQHGNESLRVKVERADLSDMVMSKDPEIVRGYSDLFQEAWNAATLLSEESIEPILQELSKRGLLEVEHD